MTLLLHSTLDNTGVLRACWTLELGIFVENFHGRICQVDHIGEPDLS